MSKRSEALSFSDGSIVVKMSGYGSLDGSGQIAFNEAALEWERHDEGPGYTRYQNLPRAELVAIRDFLNRVLTP